MTTIAEDVAAYNATQLTQRALLRSIVLRCHATRGVVAGNEHLASNQIIAGRGPFDQALERANLLITRYEVEA
jgi:precorrin-6x reductase